MANDLLRGRQVVSRFTNKSGYQLAAGDVVILDTSNPTAVTMTSGSAQTANWVGVAVETIGNNSTGRILLSGYIPRINLSSSASVGDYLKTTTIYGRAIPSSTPGTGDFGQALVTGTNPSAIIWGKPDVGITDPIFQGSLVNGKISVTVNSDNLTVAIKTLAGSDPSANDIVSIRIGDTIRSITSALSVTKNAGTNWCNAGSSELATQEIDYFVYLGYNATDGIVIGFSRISHGKLYSDFSATSTNEKYCGISTITNADANDCYENIGRFAATLSAGAGYTWTVPTFTNTNLIQRPVFETRWLNWTPTYSASESMTYTSVVTTRAKYKFVSDICYINIYAAGTTGGTASVDLFATTPITPLVNVVGGSITYYSGATNWQAGIGKAETTGKIVVSRSNESTNYPLAADSRMVFAHFYSI